MYKWWLIDNSYVKIRQMLNGPRSSDPSKVCHSHLQGVTHAWTVVIKAYLHVLGRPKNQMQHATLCNYFSHCASSSSTSPESSEAKSKPILRVLVAGMIDGRYSTLVKSQSTAGGLSHCEGPVGFSGWLAQPALPAPHARLHHWSWNNWSKETVFE